MENISDDDFEPEIVKIIIPKDKIDQLKESCHFEHGNEEACDCVRAFRNTECGATNDSFVLPSTVTDQKEIYFPKNITDAEIQNCAFGKQSSKNYVDVESPAPKRKRLISVKCDGPYEDSCQFEFGANTCQCVEKFIKKECEKNVDVILPATVIDKEEIHFPENITHDDPSIYGKWLIFTNGNFTLQNHLWIQLQKLIKSRDLILLLSSTAKPSENHRPFRGVIMCYTSKELKIIRQAGLAIQEILQDDTVLDYKTNESSRNNCYRANGNRFITKFMMTVNGKLYKRDKLCRWTEITDAEYENYKFEENSSENYSAHGSLFGQRPQSDILRYYSDSNLLPSLETRKKFKKYVYPNAARIRNSSGLWCINCGIADVNDDGLTELDTAWKEAKALQEENYFLSVTCQTKAFKFKSKVTLSRRTIMFEVHERIDVKQIIQCADKIREKISYDIPMHYKIMQYKNDKPNLMLKYLYTEQRELYEYTEAKWKLLKIV